MKYVVIAVTVLLLLSTGAYALYFYSMRNAQMGEVACTLEAKQCPDGSYVGRVGPNCEFAACPTVDTHTPGEEEVSVQLNQSKSAYGVTLTPIAVLEDSRCPSDVTCVWEGRIRLQVRIQSGLGTATSIFSLGDTITTEAEAITLIEVRPYQRSDRAITDDEYEFIFLVKKRAPLKG